MVISTKILGIIAVVIIVAAAVIAWQVYPALQSGQTTNPTPTPKPSVSPTPSPSPAPTTSPTTHPTTPPTTSPTTQPTPTPTPAPVALWGVNFTGGKTINMTNLVFETEATAHSATWTQNDTNTNSTWAGISLNQLITHYADSGGISYGVLSLGYNVTVVGTDGYSKVFNSTRIQENSNNIIVANQANGTALIDKYYPLTLTGSNLTKPEGVKSIAQIQINTLLPSNMTLTLKAANGTTIVFNREDIAALPTVSGITGRNTHGTISAVGNYTGISILYLANLVGGLPNNSYYVNTNSTDNHPQALLYSQVVNGIGYATYNQTTNTAQDATQPITPILAYAYNGQLLSSKEGPFRLGFLSPEGLLTESNIWAKFVIEVDVSAS